MGRWARRVMWALGILLILILSAVTAAWLFLRGTDEPPPQDGDLAPKLPELPEGENALPLLIAAGSPWFPKELREEISSMASGENWDQALAGRVLEMNRGYLDAFDKLLAGPLSFRFPPPAGLSNEWGYLTDLRNGFYILLLRAQAAFRAGREQEALDGAIQALRLGHAVQEAGGTVDHYLMGKAIKSMTYRAILKCIARAKLPPDGIVAIEKKLRPYISTKEALAEVLRAEYASFSAGVDAVAAGRSSAYELFGWPPPGNLGDRLEDFILRQGRLFKPNRTRRLAAEAVRRMVEDIGKPEAERRGLNLPFPNANRIFGIDLAQDSTGNRACHRRFGSLMGIESFRVLANVDLASARTLIALRAFQLRRGKLPSALAELVPDFLEEIPIDPFDGKPIRYSPEKKILWSVGVDLEDSGGASKNDDGKWEPGIEHEPTYPIEF
jgi:hypothetical protein